MRQIGTFRDRVTIQKRTITQNGYGTSETWSTIKTRWARVVEISTDGRNEYQQIGYDSVTHTIIFRGNVTLNIREYRFVWRGVIFEAIDPKHLPAGIGKNTTIAVRKVAQNVES